MIANDYSPTWFETFLAPISPAQTEAEIAFLARHLPQPEYGTVLDLCCGTGRHSIPLADRGYQVTGVDLNPYALAEAARNDPNGRVMFIRSDMRELSYLPSTFDAVLCLWQSFGYFDDQTNTSILRQIGDKLRPGGRFILDIYHRAFFVAHQESRQFESNGLNITEHKQMTDYRLSVTLDYGSASPPDVFEWQLYTPDEICALANQVGLRTVLACTGFDESQKPDPARPRMQVVFAK